MFGRGFGKIGFFLLLAFTLVVSFTNTWKFISDFLPGDPPWLRPGAFVFFEGGLILWARQFKHDAENVYRMFIAGLMTLFDLLAVLSATCYEIALDVHSLGFTLPPTIASWIPLSILLVMAGQTIALVLHHFADPRFFARVQYMNETGRSPLLGSHIEMIDPPAFMSPYNIPGTSAHKIARGSQQAALPAPKEADIDPAYIPAKTRIRQAEPVGIRARFGNFFARIAGGLQNGNVQYTITPANEQADDAGEDDVDEPVTQSDDVQKTAQAGAQGPALGMIESKMLDAFLQAPANDQSTLLHMANTRSTADVTSYLKARYPDYAAAITEDRVRNVMAAYMAQAQTQADEQQEEVILHQSAAPAERPAPVRRRTAKVANKRSSDDLVKLFSLIEASQPDISVSTLARMANCDESTVRRYRAGKSKQGRA